jgi:hypothetical protein
LGGPADKSVYRRRKREGIDKLLAGIGNQSAACSAAVLDELDAARNPIVARHAKDYLERTGADLCPNVGTGDVPLFVEH